jgi:hypothetical protein
VPVTWLLRPGVGLARRDAELLQVGVDPPHVAVLPDRRSVRLLLVELAHGGPLSPLDAVTAPALQELIHAGLVVTAEDEAARPALRARLRVHLDVPPVVLPAALRAVGEAGLGLARQTERAHAILVWAEGELARDRLDDHMRAGIAHMVVRETADGAVVGPYVRPGASACVRCIDAHLGEEDPRRGLVVEQVATGEPLRPARPDPAARALTLAWVVRELATVAEGGLPATWSATVALGTLPPLVTAYRRHPHCGCAWDVVARVG